MTDLTETARYNLKSNEQSNGYNVILSARRVMIPDMEPPSYPFIIK